MIKKKKESDKKILKNKNNLFRELKCLNMIIMFIILKEKIILITIMVYLIMTMYLSIIKMKLILKNNNNNN